MTRPLRPTQADIDGLDAVQAEIMLEWVKVLNDTWELGQITLSKADTVVRRLLAIIARASDHNRGQG